MSRRPLLVGAWSLLLIVLPGSSALAYWQVTPQAQVGITYENNPRYFTKDQEAIQLELNPEAADDAFGVYLDAQLQGLLKTPSDQVTLTPRLRRTDYMRSNEDLNDADSYLDFSSTHRGTLGSIGFDARYQNTGVRSSEFERATPTSPDAPLPTNGGSGQFSDTTQKTWSLEPSFTFQLSPRNAISVSGGYSDTTYDQRTAGSTVVGGQLDYNNSSVELNLRHFLNPKNSFVVALDGGSFLAQRDGSDFENATDSFGITAAYEHTFSARLTGTANFGVSRSSVAVSGSAIGPSPSRNEERNFVGNVTLRRRAEEGYLNFSLGRTVAPGSSGSEVVQNTLRLALDRNLTPTLTGSLATIVQQQAAVGNAFRPGSAFAELVRQDRTYISADSSLSWRMTETLSLIGTYTYVFNKNDVTSGSNTTQKNNRLYLGVLYRGIGLRR